MKLFSFTIPFLLLLLGCHKDKSTPMPPSTYNPNKTLLFLVLDKQTGLPVDSAYVNFSYGNMFSQSNYTGIDGKISFTIPNDWVVNDINVNKANYCNYSYNYNSVNVQLNQTIYLNHYAYLRYHVKNIAPAISTDKMVIYSPHPTAYQGFEFTFFGSMVDSTFITPSLAGNLSISCNYFTGSTFINSFYVQVNAIGGDTTDVTVNY